VIISRFHINLSHYWWHARDIIGVHRLPMTVIGQLIQLAINSTKARKDGFMDYLRIARIISSQILIFIENHEELIILNNSSCYKTMRFEDFSGVSPCSVRICFYRTLYMRSLISYLRSKASSCAFSRIISGLRIKQRVIYLPRFARNSRLPRDISRIKGKKWKGKTLVRVERSS